MPRNDRSDSLSVRSPDDPRRPMRGLQNEAERELVQEESHETGGPAHRSASERDPEARGSAGTPRENARERSEEEEEYARAVRRATDEQDRDTPASRGDDAATGDGGNRTRGA